jgi:hypothetical protein
MKTVDDDRMDINRGRQNPEIEGSRRPQAERMARKFCSDLARGKDLDGTGSPR